VYRLHCVLKTAYFELAITLTHINQFW